MILLWSKLKKKLPTLFFILILFFSLGTNFYNKATKENIVPDTISYTKIIDSLNNLVELERNYTLLSFKDIDKPLSRTLTFYNDSIGNINLSIFLKQNITAPKLIFRYADIDCTSCIDSSLSILKEIIQKIGEQNVIILASYSNVRDLFIWKRVNKIKYPVFQIPYREIGLSVEEKNIPYFFVLLPNDETVHKLFIPIKENMYRTSSYLSFLGEHFLKKNK